jgi:F5/8 type C domain
MRARPFATAALIYTALAIALTFPLILHLTSVVPADLGDPLLTTAILWWNAHVLPLTERWWNGFAFAPAHGMLAFSDHRLGLSLMATPLQWLGASPLTAYNIIFLATFPLCALAAHALGYTLTHRHDAAALCGLSFGFNPFRVTHVSHLELLAAFAMPVALAALHLFLSERRTKWIVVFALALVLQGLCATYYLLFFLVFLALWMLWFVRDSRTAVYIFGACAAGGLVLLPIALAYQRIHEFHGFYRRYDEVLFFSGDLAAFFTASHRSIVWGFTYALSSGLEHELFPGLTITVLALAGLAVSIRRLTPIRSPQPLSLLLLAASIVAAAVSISYTAFGRWHLGTGALRILVTDAYKPASIAVLLFVLGITARRSVRSAWKRRSLFAFYATAAVFLFACSLGPEPAFFGERILYTSPYRWLMMLPVFGTSVRVPARFVMPAILALATAAALAFDHFRLSPSRRRALAIAAALGIAIEGWMWPLDLLQPPSMWPLPARYDFGTVVELPLMNQVVDFEAMYRATLHGHPVANGQSGFFPEHYRALQLAFDDGNPRGLDALAQPDPLLVVIDRRFDAQGRLNHIVEQAERITKLGGDDRWAFYGLAPPSHLACGGGDVAIASAAYGNTPIDLRLVTDGNIDTAWGTPRPQQFDDTVQVDLGSTYRLCTVRASLGTVWNAYPRDLEVTTSADGMTWTRQFKGSTAGLMVRGAIDDPRNIWMTMPLHDAAARYVRMRLDAGHPTATWIISELRITGGL